jgi:hypothetical protein
MGLKGTLLVATAGARRKRRGVRAGLNVLLIQNFAHRAQPSVIFAKQHSCTGSTRANHDGASDRPVHLRRIAKVLWPGAYRRVQIERGDNYTFAVAALKRAICLMGPGRKNGECTMLYRLLNKLIKRSNSEGVKYVSVPEELFARLLAGAIKGKGVFDERFYLETYSDVASAVRNGQIASGLEHYVVTGYYENRLPKKLIVDERFYLQENRDVADAIRRGQLRNAQEHFETAGFTEGRAPYKDFSVF